MQTVPEQIEHDHSSEPIVLNNIFFASGSAELLSESDFEIKKLTSFLNGMPEVKIQIIGHTDDIGDDKTNQILSEKRAQAVYDALIDEGIDPARLSYLGLGESTPIADNNTEEGRRINRRTEFVVLPN